MVRESDKEGEEITIKRFRRVLKKYISRLYLNIIMWSGNSTLCDKCFMAMWNEKSEVSFKNVRNVQSCIFRRNKKKVLTNADRNLVKVRRKKSD